MPWENPRTSLDGNMTKALIADEAYGRVVALMRDLAEEGSEPASRFMQEAPVTYGPFALALSLGALSEAVTELRARVAQLEEAALEKSNEGAE